jgi:hypothetical protein
VARLRLVLVLVLSVGALAACGSDDDDTQLANSQAGGDTFYASRLPEPSTFQVEVGATLPSCDSAAGADDAASVCVPRQGCKEGWVVALRVTRVDVSPLEDRFSNVARDETTPPDIRAALRADTKDSDFFVNVGVEPPDGGHREQPKTLRCLDDQP